MVWHIQFILHASFSFLCRRNSIQLNAFSYCVWIWSDIHANANQIQHQQLMDNTLDFNFILNCALKFVYTVCLAAHRTIQNQLSALLINYFKRASCCTTTSCHNLTKMQTYGYIISSARGKFYRTTNFGWHYHKLRIYCAQDTAPSNKDDGIVWVVESSWTVAGQ